MSQENVEVVRALVSEFAAGDRAGWRERIDPEVTWDTSASEMPAAGVHHGHEGVERFFRDWLGVWKDFEMVNREFLDAGDSVVAVFHQSGTGRGSGVRVERDFFGVYELRNSKVVHFRLYESREEALETAGLSE